MNLIHTRGALSTIIRTAKRQCGLNGEFEDRRHFLIRAITTHGNNARETWMKKLMRKSRTCHSGND